MTRSLILGLLALPTTLLLLLLTTTPTSTTAAPLLNPRSSSISSFSSNYQANSFTPLQNLQHSSNSPHSIKISIADLRHHLEHQPNAATAWSTKWSNPHSPNTASLPDDLASDDRASDSTSTGAPALFVNSYPFEDRLGVPAAVVRCTILLTLVLALRRWGAGAVRWIGDVGKGQKGSRECQYRYGHERDFVSGRVGGFREREENEKEGTKKDDEYSKLRIQVVDFADADEGMGL